jgi:hypothetical protein
LRGRRRNIPCFIIHPQKGGQTHHGPKGVLILEADREMRNTPVSGHLWERLRVIVIDARQYLRLV